MISFSRPAPAPRPAPTYPEAFGPGLPGFPWPHSRTGRVLLALFRVFTGALVSLALLLAVALGVAAALGAQR